jgi:hypothetical protein
MPNSRDDCEEYLEWCRANRKKPNPVSYIEFLRERKPEQMSAMLSK